MLKIVRELAVDNPLVLKIIMGIIALTFVITMGWWGIQMPGQNVVITVNKHEIEVQEYRRAYNQAIDYYRELYKDQFNAEMIEKMKVKDKVMENLVARELWLEKAGELGIRVSDEELRDNIMKMKVFHKDGMFNRTLYDRLLASNRLTTQGFEDAQRKELLMEKAKRLIKDSVSVSDDEVNDTFPLNLTGGKGVITERPVDEMQRLKKFLQFQKQEKAVNAYAAAMRGQAKIKVNKELL
jgi:peptidyl-prolyl cis-trans isomerase D